MHYYNFLNAGNAFGFVGPLIIIAAIWTLFWKGLALWHSAQRKQSAWFIIILALNTVGILEIVYLFGVAKLKFSQLFSNRM